MTTKKSPTQVAMRARSAARSGVTLLTAILCLLLTATVVVFGIWYVSWHKPGAKRKPAEKARAAQRVQAAQALAQAAVQSAQAVRAQLAAPAVALRQIGNCLAQAQAARSNLAALAASAGEVCAAANRAVTEVLGAESRDIMIPLRPSQAVPAAASESPAADPVQEDTLKEPVLLQVRNMYRSWYRMDAIAAEAAALCDEIAATNALAAATSGEALGLAAAAFGERVQTFADGEKRNEARGRLENVRGSLTAVSNMIPSLRQRLATAAEQARRQAEMEKQKREAEQREAARQEKIKTEIAAVAAAEAEDSFRTQLHRHNYDDARRLLRTVAFKLTEKESRNALEVALQRIARLEEFRDFLAAHVTGYQHVDGWKVTAADKSGITVQNNGFTSLVAWADVGDVRMVQFMRYCLMNEEQTRLLLLREQVRALVAAALYCRKFIPDNKYVQELADRMTEKALTLQPSARDDIDRILPGAASKAADAAARPAN